MDAKSPSDFLCRAWNPSIYLKSRYLYAIGNTPAEDLLQQYDLGQKLDILLLGAGDIRHILKTCCGLHPEINKVHTRKDAVKSVTFLMNDIDPVLIARNAVILDIIDGIEVTNEADVAFLWAVWYNMELSKENYQRLICILEKLLDGTKSGNLWMLGDRPTKKATRDAWDIWCRRKYDTNKMKAERYKYQVYSKRTRAQVATLKTCEYDTGDSRIEDDDFSGFANSLSFRLEFTTISEKNENQTLEYKMRNAHHKEIETWFKVGTTNPKTSNSGGKEETFINPTFMRPGSNRWHVHYGNEPYNTYLPFTREDFHSKDNLVDICFQKLVRMIKIFKKVLSYTEVKVKLCYGDGLYYCSSGFAPDVKFDVIHTSNVADNVNLVNLILCCAPRLKSERSVLLTQSMKWFYEFESINAYLKKTLGCTPGLLPTLLGVKLGVDTDLGKTSKPSVVVGDEDNLMWSKVDTDELTVINIKESIELKEALEYFADVCFKNSGPLLELEVVTSTTLITVLTLAVIIQRLQHFTVGGAKSLIDVIEEKIPDKEKNPHFLYWDIVKSAFGFEKSPEEFAVVKVPVNLIYDRDDIFTIGFAMPAVFSMVTKDAELYTKDFSCLSYIFNYMYSADDETLNFLLKKSTIESISRNSVCMTNVRVPFVTSGLPIPFFQHHKITQHLELKSEDNTSVAQPTKDQPTPTFLKSNEVTEKEDMYAATILLDNKQGSKIKVESTKFLPSNDSATNVCLVITCDELKRSVSVNLQLSCYVVSSPCKIQISSKKGQVMCILTKHKYHNIGRNILPLSHINLKKLQVLKRGAFSDLTMHLGVMFSGKRDIEQKQSGKSSSDPFFNMRETICIIWKTIYNSPKKVLFVLKCEEHRSMEESKGNVLDIFIHQTYWYQGLPLLHVKYLDWMPVFRAAEENPVKGQMMIDEAHEARFNKTGYEVRREVFCIRKVSKEEAVQLIPSLINEQDLFRKLLYTNSFQLSTKETSITTYKDSFIQLYYPREVPGNFDLKSKIIGGKKTKIPESSTAAVEETFTCAACRKKGQNLKKCSRCKQVHYCDQTCQRSHWKIHKASCKNIN